MKELYFFVFVILLQFILSRYRKINFFRIQRELEVYFIMNEKLYSVVVLLGQMFLEEELRLCRVMKQILLVILYIVVGKKKVYYWENININKFKWRCVIFLNNVSLLSLIIVDRSSLLRFFNIYIFFVNFILLFRIEEIG